MEDNSLGRLLSNGLAAVGLLSAAAVVLSVTYYQGFFLEIGFRFIYLISVPDLLAASVRWLPLNVALGIFSIVTNILLQPLLLRRISARSALPFPTTRQFRAIRKFSIISGIVLLASILIMTFFVTPTNRILFAFPLCLFVILLLLFIQFGGVFRWGVKLKISHIWIIASGSSVLIISFFVGLTEGAIGLFDDNTSYAIVVNGENTPRVIVILAQVSGGILYRQVETKVVVYLPET